MKLVSVKIDDQGNTWVAIPHIFGPNTPMFILTGQEIEEIKQTAVAMWIEKARLEIKI